MAAAACGISTDECFYPMKIGYHEGTHRCAHRHLIFNAVSNGCAAQEIESVYLGGPRERFKQMWTSQLKRNLEGFIFNKSVSPKLIHGVNRQSIFVPKHYRRRLQANVSNILKPTTEAAEQKGWH